MNAAHGDAVGNMKNINLPLKWGYRREPLISAKKNENNIL